MHAVNPTRASGHGRPSAMRTRLGSPEALQLSQLGWPLTRIPTGQTGLDRIGTWR